MGPDSGDHEVRDEANKDTVVHQVEVEHDLPKLDTISEVGDDDIISPYLGPLVPHQSPAQRVREELWPLVSDHQLERVGGVHVLVLIVILTHLGWEHTVVSQSYVSIYPTSSSVALLSDAKKKSSRNS